MRQDRSRSDRSRAEHVYERLLEALRSGKGPKRLREEEIARALGVSRTPVREALARLQERGLVEATPLGLMAAQLGHQQTLELYALRAVLEGAASRFAAQHASEGEILTLRQLCTAFAGALGSPETLARLNRQFHLGIIEAAQNRYLKRALEDLHVTLALLPSTTFTVAGRPEAAVAEHAAILEAIARRDAAAAEAAARGHIHNAQVARLQVLFRDMPG